MARILLVVDDALLARAIARQLHALAAVDIAAGRSGALGLAANGAYDVAIVDLVLGADDGESVVRSMLEMRPRCIGMVLFLNHETPIAQLLTGVPTPNILMPSLDVSSIVRIVGRLLSPPG